MWWEFGEHIAFVLWPVGLFWKPIERRWPRLACDCLRRRRWLNEYGEGLYRQWFPERWYSFRLRWRRAIRKELSQFAILADELSDNVSLTNRDTFDRWMDQMERAGVVRSVVMSGRKLYGLPGKSCT